VWKEDEEWSGEDGGWMGKEDMDGGETIVICICNLSGGKNSNVCAYL
jgi:hypothetical protein